MSKEIKPRDVRYYTHQNNTINDRFIRIAEMTFSVPSITMIGPSGSFYSQSSIDNDNQAFLFVSDGREYQVIVDKNKIEKIREKMLDYVFPSDDKKDDKVFI